MLSSGSRHISIRNRLLLVISAITVGTSLLFAVSFYARQKRTLMLGIDTKLYTATQLARMVPREGYFDRIEDRDSVSQEEYLRIVSENNRLARELGLQYLWSCMLLEGQVVFTTATSPSKDVRNMDHASFLEVHRDPQAFDKVFSTMQPDFSSFRNEWGHGRMVLVPYEDSRGRPYCVGASMSIAEINALMRRTLWHSLTLTAFILFAGILTAVVVSNSLTRPIARLTAVANSIAHGRMDLQIEGRGSSEIESLASSIAFMRDSIRDTISALRFEIRERKVVQQQLQEHRDHLEEQVEKRTAALERSNLELQQFAYVASHDLQEPLRKIIAFGNLLMEEEQDRLSDDGRDYVDRMQSAARRMQDLINGLLSYSRVTTRARPFEHVDMNEIVSGVASDLETRVQETGGRIEAGPLPAVEADPMQMRQLMQNLIGNGLKFHKPDEPPVVRVSGATVTQDDEEFCRITVEDNGIGFDPKFQDRIFNIFQRLHGPGAYEGSGIGLAVCRKIVDRHGGTISVASEAGKGAAFTVLLPVRHPHEMPAEEEAAAEPDRDELSPAS